MRFDTEGQDIDRSTAAGQDDVWLDDEDEEEEKKRKKSPSEMESFWGAV